MLKILLVFAVLLMVSPALAQVPTAVTTPTAQDLENQLSQVGCNAERAAAAQTIVNLQKQNADLQKQLAKDPPAPKAKPGKH